MYPIVFRPPVHLQYLVEGVQNLLVGEDCSQMLEPNGKMAPGRQIGKLQPQLRQRHVVGDFNMISCTEEPIALGTSGSMDIVGDEQVTAELRPVFASCVRAADRVSQNDPAKDPIE